MPFKNTGSKKIDLNNILRKSNMSSQGTRFIIQDIAETNKRDKHKHFI